VEGVGLHHGHVSNVAAGCHHDQLHVRPPLCEPGSGLGVEGVGVEGVGSGG